MSEPIHTIAAYVPQSLTRAVLSDPSPTPPTQPQTKRMSAAILFADVSGFTPLTEALGQKGSEGPEELTRILNTYFSWMIAFVEAEGGEVVKFGGDALTVVFPADDEPLRLATRRALQAAETMRGAMDEFGIVESSVGLVALKMKFGIGAGEVLTTQVGGLFNRWEYFIAGDALRQATQAENRAEQGDIVLSPEAEASIARQRLSRRPLPELDWPSVKNPAAVISVLRHYIPGPVRTWLDGKLHDWLATLRPMSVMFAGIKGLDYNQFNTVDELHKILRDVQKIIYNYWGTLTRLTIDDKGTVLLVLFGAPPYSHEDDPERALRCALDLQELASGRDLNLAIGVTTGRVFAGPVGGTTRREYTVMGDAVNLAARLMVAAGPGRICCNYETYRSTYDKIRFEPLPPMEIKGKAGFIPIYRPLENYQPLQLAQIRRGEANDRLVGRQAELERLVASLEIAKSGGNSIAIIEGEAGIGKTRLVEQLVEMTNVNEQTIVLGMGRSIEQETPYHAWKGILATFFGLDTTNGVATMHTEQQQRIRDLVRSVAPEMEESLPLLNEIFNLNLPHNNFTASLNASLREQHLATFTSTLLQAWAAEKPLIIVLEDAHWLDPASWRLAVQIAVASIKEQTPLMLILVMRPLEDVNMRTDTNLLTALEEAEYIRLDSLSTDETLALAARRMGLSRNELPEAVAELVQRRAGGNPFFAEELFYTLHDNGTITFKTMGDRIRCLISGDLDRAAQTLPTTIQSVVLTRIDQLPPEKQLTLRVAAVIGQTFSQISLYDTLREHRDIPERLFNDYLNDLTYLGLIRAKRRGPSPTYEFRHVIIREVSYQSLLFEWRRKLHRTVAGWYENTYSPEANQGFPAFEPELNASFTLLNSLPPSATPLAPFYSLLVYHWHQAEDEERELHYASLIAEQAANQFANSEALGYLNRALDLAKINDLEARFKLLQMREAVFDRLGERERQSLDLMAMADIAGRLKDSPRQVVVALRQANYAEATGDYPAALDAAQQAVDLARKIGDKISESTGHILKGIVFLRRSEYQSAQERFEQALSNSDANNQIEAVGLLFLATNHWLQGEYSKAHEYCHQVLAICHDHGYSLVEAQCLNILGLVHYYQSEFPLAQENFDRAITLAHTVGYRRTETKPFHNIGLIHLKLGNYEAARDYFEQAYDIDREIGDREGQADTLSNLGIIYGTLGDYNAARNYLSHSLDIRKEIGSQAGEANTLNKFAFIYHHLGDYRSTKRYCNMAFTIQQKIGDREGEQYSLTYLGHALAGLNDLDGAAAAYDKALNLFRDLEETSRTVDVSAGKAYVAMQQNQPDQALAAIAEILDWIDVHGIAGIDKPLWVYLTVYNILMSSSQDTPADLDRAKAVLAAAYRILQEQAACIEDENLRHTFLNTVKINRDIIKIWDQMAPPPE